MDLTAILDQARALQPLLWGHTVVVERPTVTVTSGTSSTTFAPVYDGPGRVTVEAAPPTVTPSGEVAAFPAAYVTIPHTATPKRGDRVTVTAGTPAVPGPLWVEAVEAGAGTATRFLCRAVR